ncbi:hypothetical protein Tco_1072624 [Tanacetum coccineum]
MRVIFEKTSISQHFCLEQFPLPNDQVRGANAQKLEPKVHIPGLECNRSLLEGVQFVNNQVIEHPENGIFFIDVFGDEAFQRMSDIHKSLIDSHPDKEKPKSKRAKLEAVGYSLN